MKLLATIALAATLGVATVSAPKPAEAAWAAPVVVAVVAGAIIIGTGVALSARTAQASARPTHHFGTKIKWIEACSSWMAGGKLQKSGRCH